MATAAARVGDLLGDLSASTSQARKRPAEPSLEASPAKRRSGVKAVSSLDYAAFQVSKQRNLELLQLLYRPAWPPSAPTCGVDLTVRIVMEKCHSPPYNWLAEVGLLCRERRESSNVLPAGVIMIYFFQYLHCVREILSLVLPSVTSLVFKQFLAKQVTRVV